MERPSLQLRFSVLWLLAFSISEASSAWKKVQDRCQSCSFMPKFFNRVATIFVKFFSPTSPETNLGKVSVWISWTTQSAIFLVCILCFGLWNFSRIQTSIIFYSLFESRERRVNHSSRQVFQLHPAILFFLKKFPYFYWNFQNSLTFPCWTKFPDFSLFSRKWPPCINILGLDEYRKTWIEWRKRWGEMYRGPRTVFWRRITWKWMNMKLFFFVTYFS